ncbi:DNA-directed RNA polymerase subunit beta' [Candidatus Beckwithbacteria bacterium RBG_13_35_6]|uniref:DNA-directed RNA polymerase subunit beta' n=1 Tax=Candidatus Beckwithbacteria bacterium RBG_13_35_6 TaxID=1797456 RepID=A0A1F5DHM9_9BACT|nr:MAG: DNA-directed RNA polymerase subunit beta' [Candidatus Beckwithbacteria bacterium RBG_13_35_6]
MNKNIIDFKELTIKLASPEEMKAWSHGEITKPETINYRTLKPEKDGLFCERIFGPTKDWECYCGKYKRIRYRGIICDKCGVEVTQSRVRRERMGHINLACPVAHVWYFKGGPSKLSLVLDITPRNLAGIIYFARYLVLSVDEEKRKETLHNLEDHLQKTYLELETNAKKDTEIAKKEGNYRIDEIKKKIKSREQQELAISEAKIKTKQEINSIKDNLDSEKETAEEIYKTVVDIVKKINKKSVLTEEEYLRLMDYKATQFIKAGMGAESILDIIRNINLDKLAASLKKQAQEISGQKKVKAVKRLRVIEGMRKAGVDPAWMILKTLPVLPPDLRPMVQLSGGRFASSDLNDLYRRVINRNNRLKHLINLGAPEIILRNEKRMLQEAVDTLIDISQSGKPRRRGTKELRSLSEMLRGKQGRFRQNLLGKRVDYSGRSVIIVGPDLKLNQCGLPKEMALEMFKPYVLREIIAAGLAPNVKSAKRFLEQKPPEIFDILEKVTKDHPVLLNRAPTLHKLGIQAFFPVLIGGNAIEIHPCVCAGYNADFDGDQMAVHVPLSKNSKNESIKKMMPAYNLLKPADGSPITLPNKEMALGCYYLTSVDSRLEAYDKTIFKDEEEVIFAYQTKIIVLRQPIKVKMKGEVIVTTVGRIIFNKSIPEVFAFINNDINAGYIKRLVEKAIKILSVEETAKLIDDLKDLGFYYATLSGISVSVADCKLIPDKEKIIDEANKKAAEIESNFSLGLITQEEKRRLSNELWMDTTEKIADKTWDNFEPSNSVKVIINSGGTRASKDQVKQIAAMRGLVVDPLGKIVELPTKSNFREGLSVFEYVNSSRGSRKGLTDSALKTADAGYLTRRLVDVAHDMIIREEDCKTKKGIIIAREGARASSFIKRLLGRMVMKDVIYPKTHKKIVAAGEVIDEEICEKIDKAKVKEVLIRSPLKCQAKYGLCRECYGWDYSTNKMVEIGVPVGVIAAQSIGEPGTQLTMRVRHTGGIVGLDVTQGLPRVEELFEARIPKVLSPLAEIPGKVKVEETSQGYKIVVKNKQVKPVEEKEYLIPLTSTLRVKTGDLVSTGSQLASGGLDLKDILRLKGIETVQTYLVDEVQKIYESQGIPIKDKHFEVIIRKMSDKVRIETDGDTSLLPGELVSKHAFEEENAATLAKGGRPATAKVIILGITRASLYTDSWLSAASFQETSNVLTDASLKGETDKLLGLKENVIIGRLVPTSKERAMIKE